MKAIYAAALAVGVQLMSSCVKDPVQPISKDVDMGMEKGLQSRKIDIHLILGQSNCTGQGLVSTLLSPYNTAIRNALIWNDATGTLDTLRAGVNNEGGGCGGVTPSNAFGPEISFAHRLCSQSRKTTIFVKRAFNASRLYPITIGSPNWWEAPDALGACNPQYSWHPSDPASQYHALLTECQALNAHLINNTNRLPDYKSVLWYQGESDSQYIQRAQAWGDNMNDFIDQLRIDLNAPDLKLVIVRTTRNLAGYAFADTVRVRQAMVGSQPNCNWVDADPWVNQGQLHANSDDLIAIGKGAADTLNNM